MPYKKVRQRLKIFSFIKYIFIAIAITSVSVISYYVFVNKDSQIRQDISVTEVKSSEPDVSFKAVYPSLKGISIENGPYYIKADHMEKLSKKIFFTNPKINSMLNQLNWLNLTANRAEMQIDDNYLELFDNIKVDFDKQHYLTTEQVEMSYKNSIIKTNKYMKLYSDEYSLESDNGFTLNYQDQVANIYGRVNLNIQKDDDKFNTSIKSNTANIFWLKKEANFLGNVILLRDGTKVKANKMKVVINPSTNTIDRIYTYGNVKIIDQENIATSEYGEYIISTSILTLKDKVTLSRNDNILSGELLHYNFLKHKADLIGSNKQNNSSQQSNGRVKAVIMPKE